MSFTPAQILSFSQRTKKSIFEENRKLASEVFAEMASQIQGGSRPDIFSRHGYVADLVSALLLCRQGKFQEALFSFMNHEGSIGYHNQKAFTDNKIFFPAFPKSGSTYVADFFAFYYNLKPRKGIDHTQHTPFHYSLFWVSRGAEQDNSIIESHGYSDPTLLYILMDKKFKIVFQVRNIFGALESIMESNMPWRLANHDSSFGYPYFDSKTRVPMNSTPDPVALRTHAIMKHAAGYCTLFASWFHAHKRINFPIMTYELLRANENLYFRTLLRCLDGGVDEARLAATLGKINAKKTNAPQALRINKTNRPTYGEFNDEQKAMVRAYYQNFPGVNFKLIDPEYDG